MKFLFGGKMTNTDKHNQTTKNHPPMNLDSLESLSSVSPPNMSKPNYTLPTRAPNRTYQSSDLPTILFLSKRGMSRSPLAQEIMRNLLQKSSYFGRIRVSSRGVNVAYNDCSVDGRMQTYASKLGLILHGSAKFATIPELANASLIISMDADSEDFTKIHKHSIRGQVRPIGIFFSPGSEPYVKDPYDRDEQTDVDVRYDSIIESVTVACNKILSVVPSLVL